MTGACRSTDQCYGNNMKKILFTGLVMGMAVAVYAQSSDDGQSAAQQPGWGASTQSSNSGDHGWGSTKASAENGRMTEHGWVPPAKKDCSFNGEEISGSAQLRCMK
jgi:hypothetical protein